MTGTSDSTSPAVPIRVDVRSEVVQQVDGITNTAGSNNALPSMHGVNGVNGCSTSVSNDVNLLAPELFFLILAHLYIKCE